MANTLSVVLKKYIDGVVHEIYPKTKADVVEYSDDKSVADVISSLQTTISELETRIATLESGQIRSEEDTTSTPTT